MLSRLYGTLAAQRRRWYERRPEAQRRLNQPVVSVGALAVGGSGKTPVAAHLAETLVSMGECPALLSRGYRREHPVDGVVVVRDPQAIRSDVAMAGDEPMMLARVLRDTSVLVAEDRYLAGRLAETNLGATVHLLDDGFQHLSLHRDVDLLVLGPRDAADPRTLPGGRLREPLETASRADALIVETRDADEARQLAHRLDVERAFHFTRTLRPPRDAETHAEVAMTPDASVLAVAGIARPEAFFGTLRRNGYEVADTVAFRDHHLFSAGDLSDIARRADMHGIRYVVTTEKDLVRLLPHAPFAFQLVWVPLTVSVEPGEHLRTWLSERMTQARESA